MELELERRNIMSAYDKMYLDQNMKTNRLLFKMFKQSNYDFDSCVKQYLSTSEIRKKMDMGNWSALNKGVKQLWNSIDYKNIPQKHQLKNDDGLDSEWISDIYVYFQWMYELSMQVIVDKLPPDKLANTYNPLHETSLQNACIKLYNKFFAEG